ncbi:MAG: MFS transporter [Pseudomonadota bacterium]
MVEKLFYRYIDGVFKMEHSQSGDRLNGVGQEFKEGWPVLAAAMFALALSVSGLPLYTIGVFIDPLAQEFGWARSSISLWSFFLLAGFIFMSPVVGRAVDHFGPRRVAIFSIPVLALCTAALSLISSNIWTLYAGVLLMSVLGAGASGITYTRLINGWFDTGRGLALGFLAAGIGIMSIVGPRLVQAIVDEFGWRIGFLSVAAITATALPVAFLIFKDHKPHSIESATRSRPALVGLTRSEALRGEVFWLLAVSFLLFSMLASGAIVTLVPFLTDLGLSRESAASYAGLFGLGSLSGRIITGFLFDRFHAAIVCAIVYFLAALAIAFLGYEGTSFLVLTVLLIGFSLGTEVDAMGYCTARYFGLKAYGDIYAVFAIVISIGGGLSPYVINRLREASGGYELPFTILSVLAIVSSALMFRAGKHSFLEKSDLKA